LNASRLDGSKYQVKETNPNIPRTLSDQIPNALPKQIVINYNLDYVDKNVQECVFWFGRDYPYRAPYENDPLVITDFLRKRDTYAPNVFSGDRPLDTTNITDPYQFSPINNFNYGTVLRSQLVQVMDQIRSLDPNANNLDVIKRNLVNQIPWGTILFDNIGDKFKKQWNYTLQFGYDNRLYSIASFPFAGFRRVAQQNQLSNAILRTVLENNGSTIRPTITTGFRSMPHLYTDIIDLDEIFSSLI
ncbi:3466_t:CDS:2, partial [Racocetra fulgida]